MPQANKRRRQLIGAALLAAGVGAVAAAGSALVVQGFDGLLPDARRIASFNRPGTVTVLSADGQVLQKLGPATREKVAKWPDAFIDSKGIYRRGRSPFLSTQWC